MSISINEPHQSHEDKVRKRAYEIWANRVADGRPGTAESDWLAAEQELEEER